MNNDDKFVLVTMGIVCFVGFFLVWGILIFDCKTYKEATGKEVKLEYGTCYVKAGGEWFSKNQIRGVK
jgi:hypothetical protein